MFIICLLSFTVYCKYYYNGVKQRCGQKKESVQDERKHRRTEGKSYLTSKSVLVQEEAEPKEGVRILWCLSSVANVVKRRRHGQYSKAEDSKRQATICISLPNGKGDAVQVCRNIFIHVYAITKRRIQTLGIIRKKRENCCSQKSAATSRKRVSSQRQI